MGGGGPTYIYVYITHGYSGRGLLRPAAAPAPRAETASRRRHSSGFGAARPRAHRSARRRRPLCGVTAARSQDPDPARLAAPAPADSPYSYTYSPFSLPGAMAAGIAPRNKTGLRSDVSVNSITNSDGIVCINEEVNGPVCCSMRSSVCPCCSHALTRRGDQTCASTPPTHEHGAATFIKLRISLVPSSA